MTARTVGRGTLPALLLALVLGAAHAARAGDEAPLDDDARLARLLEALKDKDPSARVKALEQARDDQAPALLAPLQRLLGDRELGVRLGAVEALAARTEPTARRKAAGSLASRLGRLAKGRADHDEVAALIAGLARLGQPAGIKPLLAPITIEMDLEEVQARLDAVASIPHPDSVEALIDFLAKGRRGGREKHRRAANDALRHLTGANPSEHKTAGRDADRWRAWWKDNKKVVDLEQVAADRAEAQAQRRAREERRKKQQEERKKKRAERKKKGGKKQPEPQPPAPID